MVNAKLLVLGVLVFFAGVTMPAETKEVTWNGADKMVTYQDNELKSPVMVGGGLLAVASLIIAEDSLRSNSTQSDNPPDD